MRCSMLTKKENIKNEVKGSKTAKSTPTPNPATQATSCCQPPAKTADHAPAKTPTPQTAKHQTDTHTYSSDKKGSAKTRITVKYDVGFNNQLYIRGKGANLSWDKGQPLKNVKPDEWVWETDAHFTNCEFKILINDRVYENGDNHHLNAGSNLLYTPHFY
jgi:hypothetical protein